MEKIAGTIAILVVICVILFYIYRMMKREMLDKPNTTVEKGIYDVELYFENGELFKKYSNVYVTHWDNNIYIFKNDNLNELVHKSENMILVRKKI